MIKTGGLWHTRRGMCRASEFPKPDYDLRLIGDVGELVVDCRAAREEDFSIGKQCRVPPVAIIAQIWGKAFPTEQGDIRAACLSGMAVGWTRVRDRNAKIIPPCILTARCGGRIARLESRRSLPGAFFWPFSNPI
jgi:hypothetical protein